MSFTPVAALAALAVLLAACGSHLPESTLSIRGQLAVPGRVELPPDAQMVVELRDETTDRVLAEQRQPLREISSPQPFDLQLPRDKLVPGQQLTLRGALLMRGWAQWLSAPVAIDASPDISRTRYWMDFRTLGASFLDSTVPAAVIH